MKRWLALLLLLSATAAHAQPAPAASLGPAIKRIANLSDGAPAFEVLDASGRRVVRIECVWNGWYEADAMAARLLASGKVMAAIIAKGGLISLEDLGPAYFDCVVVASKATARQH